MEKYTAYIYLYASSTYFVISQTTKPQVKNTQD